jgi:hypothetical protein
VCYDIPISRVWNVCFSTIENFKYGDGAKCLGYVSQISGTGLYDLRSFLCMHGRVWKVPNYIQNIHYVPTIISDYKYFHSHANK